MEETMKILLAEDDFVTRKFMLKFLSKYGECDVTVDGMEAVDAFMMALEDDEPYDLVCLDIMMPVMDGYQALQGIRNLEKEREIPEDKAVKVVMTTALNDEKNVNMAFELGCTVYSGKPIDQDRFEQALKKLGLI
jgi:two-component system chemotaxis response regulator CheY